MPANDGVGLGVGADSSCLNGLAGWRRSAIGGFAAAAVTLDAIRNRGAGLPQGRRVADLARRRVGWRRNRMTGVAWLLITARRGSTMRSAKRSKPGSRLRARR